MKGTKRLTAAITTLFAAGALAVSASAAAAHNYKGDINRDDKVNITDLVCLNKHFQGISYIPEENIVYADMDGNGRLNVIDFMFLKIAALSDAEPEEIEITAPAETTPAVTTKTTAAATTAVTTKTTAATTKVTTAATTKTATTSTTKAAAVTTTTTASSTNKTSSATTTTTTTTTTKASSAATTTTTTTTTKATTTTTASEAATSKTYPAKVGNGVNDLADISKDRAFIILGGDNNACKYDADTNINDFVPGSVQMPEITGDKSYKASFYVYDEAIIEKTGGTFISNTYLRILKAGTWETYTDAEKPNLKITVTKVTTDGVQRDLSEITQKSNASLDISSVLGSVNNVEIEFTVEGFNSTSSSGGSSSGESSGSGTSTPSGKVLAGTDVDRAVLAFGEVIKDTTAYTNNDDFTTTNMPEITGNGTYTASFTSDSGIDVYYMGVQLMKGGSNDNKAFYQAYPNVKINVSSVKVNGIEKKGSKKLSWDGTETDTVLTFEQRQYEAYVNIFGENLTQMTGNSVKSVEVTFTVSGM